MKGGRKIFKKGAIFQKMGAKHQKTLKIKKKTLNSFLFLDRPFPHLFLLSQSPLSRSTIAISPPKHSSSPLC
jgi:hypothetical protein